MFGVIGTFHTNVGFCFVFSQGSYIQVGDIVSVSDFEDNIYYAQIRGLLVDTYCEKSAFITWLIPTQSSPPPNERFEPSTYLIGNGISFYLFSSSMNP